LLDGKHAEYVGYVTGPQRSKLLGRAKALLYPIQYPEAFGLVLIEAMFCGTPVAATNFGAVPEIVERTVTGCIAESMEQFPEVVKRAMTLNRHAVRAAAEGRFSSRQMASAYLRAYQQAATR